MGQLLHGQGRSGIICSTRGRPCPSALQAPASRTAMGGPQPQQYLSGLPTLCPPGPCTAKPTHVVDEPSFCMQRGRMQSSNSGSVLVVPDCSNGARCRVRLVDCRKDMNIYIYMYTIIYVYVGMRLCMSAWICLVRA